MVDFAGWEMPVQYKGILAEHEHTRKHVSLFDICHMGEFRITGDGAAAALDAVFARPVADQKTGVCRYNFLLDEAGMQPMAGAHGELTGVMLIAAWHKSRNDFKRKKMLIPDAAHGTNPASAVVAGFECCEIATDANGNVDLENLKANLDDTVAGLMLTCPNTLGLFDPQVEEICRLVHAEILPDLRVAPVAALEFEDDVAHLGNPVPPARPVVADGRGDAVVAVLFATVEDHARQVRETQFAADAGTVEPVHHLEPGVFAEPDHDRLGKPVFADRELEQLHFRRRHHVGVVIVGLDQVGGNPVNPGDRLFSGPLRGGFEPGQISCHVLLLRSIS